MIISQLLKEARLKADLSQKDVSDQLGYTSPQFVSNWERGVSRPPLEICKELCKILQLPKSVLFKALKETYEEELREALE